MLILITSNANATASLLSKLGPMLARGVALNLRTWRGIKFTWFLRVRLPRFEHTHANHPNTNCGNVTARVSSNTPR